MGNHVSITNSTKMKEQLKYIDVNGYGILLDESAEIKEGDYIIFKGQLLKVDCFNDGVLPEFIHKYGNTLSTCYNVKLGNYTCFPESIKNNKIVFAEKELNLDVPVLPDWRNWEVEQFAKSYVYSKFDSDGIDWLIAKPMIDTYIYCHNKAKYTEEDLEQMFMIGLNCSQEINMKGMTKEDGLNYQSNKLYKAIQSLKKIPKYIVMKDEKIEEIERDHDEDVNGDKAFKHKCWQQRLKIITNSEGKPEGIIKEIIF